MRNIFIEPLKLPQTGRQEAKTLLSGVLLLFQLWERSKQTSASAGGDVFLRGGGGAVGGTRGSLAVSAAPSLMPISAATVIPRHSSPLQIRFHIRVFLAFMCSVIPANARRASCNPDRIVHLRHHFLLLVPKKNPRCTRVRPPRNHQITDRKKERSVIFRIRSS